MVRRIRQGECKILPVYKMVDTSVESEFVTLYFTLPMA